MRHSLQQLATVLLLPIAIAACGNAGTPGNTQADTMGDAMAGGMAAQAPANPAGIDSLRDAYTRALEAGNVDAMAGMFTDDAVLLGADGKVHTGSDIRKYVGDTTMVASNVHIDKEHGPNISGDLAWETGTFSEDMKPKKGGKSMTAKGNYLVVLKRQADGSWKVAAEADIPTQMPQAMSDSMRR